MSLGDLSDPKAKNHVVSLHAVATLAAVRITGRDSSGWASIQDLLEPLLNSGRGRGFGCQQEGPDSWGSHVLAPAWLRTARVCFCELRACHPALPRGQIALCVPTRSHFIVTFSDHMSNLCLPVSEHTLSWASR